ncbi:MAG: deoxyribonuclease IV [Planctomycetota bacterium]|jgi:deoxyribonuclease-4
MHRRIGFHVSIEGGLPEAIGRALERGCTAMQVFCGNPRGWKLRSRGAEEIEQFRRDRAQTDLTPLFVHSCYLINPCSLDRGVLRRSVSRLAAELELAQAIGVEYYVLHPGSHKGRPAQRGVRRAAGAIAQALNRAHKAPMILLENTAAPHGPGGDLRTLGEVAARIKDAVAGAAVGAAVDSCHAFGAGYDLRQEREVERLVGDVDQAIGLDGLRLLHVNDSRDEPGSKRDRHAHIGEGTIGRKGLRNFLNHPALSALPLILETPWESVEVDRRNLQAVLDLLAAPE